MRDQRYHGRAFVLLTARKGEPAPDAVTALWPREVTTRIDVSLLADEPMGRLVELAVDGPVDGLSRQRLCRLCAGSPPLLREVLHRDLEPHGPPPPPPGGSPPSSPGGSPPPTPGGASTPPPR